MTDVAALDPLVRPDAGHRRERVIEALLFAAAALGVVTTIGIVVVLLVQTIEFFQLVTRSIS